MKVRDYTPRERKDANLILARHPSEYLAAQNLIREYADSLGFSLDFQNFEQEIDQLTSYYGPPTGAIVLTKAQEEYVGCTCVRNLGDGIAEIKRMYVKPNFRGQGFGRQMLLKAIEEAKRLGYRFLRLDTIPDMESAIRLYLSVGFYEIEDYTYNPIPGARFMEYKL